MQMIHGNGQCLMGFLRDRTIRHGTGLEPLHDLFRRLHLFERNTLAGESKVQKTPQISGFFRVHHLRILQEFIIISFPCSTLQHVDRLRIVPVMFALRTSLVPASRSQLQIHIQPQRIEGPAVLRVDSLADLLQRDPANPAESPCKIFMDDIP